MVDRFGIPVRRRYDVMISYQWANQDLVRDIYMDLKVTANLNVWFDIMGGMQASVYWSMATAIENCDCLLVFLSAKYLASFNCLLEIKYASSLGKPILYVVTEPDLKIPADIRAAGAARIFQVSSMADVSKLEGNLPILQHINYAIRALQKTRGSDPSQLLSTADTAEVLQKRALLRQSLDMIAEQQGKSRYSVCGRCKAKFEVDSVGGCKKHRAYFVGGTLIAGRWVCCSQTQKDALGCEPCDHSADEFEFVVDPNYGTTTFEVKKK